MRASYHARLLGAGQRLRTVGVLVLGGDELAYRSTSPSQRASVEEQIAALRQHLSAAEVFADLLRRANGVTVEWSDPVEVGGSSAAEVAEDLLMRLPP